MGVLIKASGLPDAPRRAIYRRYHSGDLTKLAPGVFAPRDALAALTPWEHYQLRCAAVGYAYPAYTLVGKSAAAVWDIPYGSVPQHVEVARLRGAGGVHREWISMRRLACIPGQIPQHHRGVNVTSPLQTVLDMGRWEALADAVTATDHCLHNTLFTHHDLGVGAASLAGHKGAGGLEALKLLAQGASESPRESALRVAMWEQGFPAPELQATIVNEKGQFLGRVDALFAGESVLVEYDGTNKYQHTPGRSTEKALLDERRREKELLNLGTRMIRVTAETFSDGRWVADLRRELDLGRGRPLSEQLWSSEGLGWGSLDDKKTRGAAYPV